jgi:hypothetical protein
MSRFLMKMSPARSALAAALLAVATALPLVATAGTVGPLPDGDMQAPTGDQPQAIWYKTSWQNGYMISNDLERVLSRNGYLIVYAARIFVTTPDPVPPKGGSALLTTVYSQYSPDGGLTGFMADGSDFKPLTTEVHSGGAANPKKKYKAYSQVAVAGTDLQAYLPDMDLSSFDTTTSSVYWVSQTKVPMSFLARQK